MRERIRLIALSMTCILPSAVASATTLSFEDLPGFVHGKIVDNQYAFLGITINATNPNRSFDLAAIFDSTRTGTQDPDLENAFSGGNAQNTVLGNMLIISETDRDPLDSNFVLNADADDEGQRPAGTIAFDLAVPRQMLGFHAVDFEPGAEVNNSAVRFFLDGEEVGSKSFLEIAAKDPTIQYGDNFANLVQPFSIGSAFDEVVFHFGGSGAIDNIVFVPEPHSVLLIGVGLLLLGRRARRTPR